MRLRACLDHAILIKAMPSPVSRDAHGLERHIAVLPMAAFLAIDLWEQGVVPNMPWKFQREALAPNQ